MQAVGALVLVSAALLATAGVAKILRPAAAVTAMRAVRLPADPILVRILGLGELAVAVIVMATAARFFVAIMGIAYLSFAVFAIVSMRSGGGESCGCFGEASTPPGAVHVVVDLAAVAVAVAALSGAPPSLVEMAGDGLWRSLLLVAGTLIAVYLLVALLTALPQALRSATDFGSRR
jgi:hypothetical protein